MKVSGAESTLGTGLVPSPAVAQTAEAPRAAGRTVSLWRRYSPGRNMRVQLTAWYGAALLVLLVLLGLFVYWLLSTNLRRDAENQLKGSAAQILSNLSAGEGGINFQDTQAQGGLVLVYGATGTLSESTGGSQSYRPSTLPSWVSPANGQATFNTVSVPALGGRWLLYAVPIPGVDQSTGSTTATGAGWLIVGRSLEPIYGMLNETLYALAVAGPLVILLACIGGYFTAGRALGPVRAITRTARRIQAEGLGRGTMSRIGIEGRSDELGELASTFDSMLARLDETFKRERRFTADAAHELRTPLAVVQAETSVALSRTRPVAEYKRVLASVESESERMGKLITDLLTLVRADEGQHQMAHDPIDLSSLCHTVAGQLSAMASGKGVSLTGGIQDGVTVVGDSTWLAQMLLNLVDNGIKYTRAGGWVKLQLAESRNEVVVSVEDNGIGISSEQLPHVFDRFYRADQSRTRDGEATGLGLGLAICDWIAKSHGGRIDVTSEMGSGSRFVVYLPRPGYGNHGRIV